VATFADSLQGALEKLKELQESLESYENALVVVMEAAYCEAFPNGPSLASFPRYVKDLPLTTGSRNWLLRQGIGFTLHLLCFSPDEIYSLRGIGDKRFMELDEKIYLDYHLTMGMIKGETAKRISEIAKFFSIVVDRYLQDWWLQGLLD